MSHVQYVDFVSRHRKKNSVFVISTTVEDFADFSSKCLTFRRKRATFRKNLQGTDGAVNTIKPAVGGVRLSLPQPQMRFRDVPLSGEFYNNIPPLHFLRRGI